MGMETQWLIFYWFAIYISYSGSTTVSPLQNGFENSCQNVCGLNTPFKCTMFWGDAPKSRADGICIQETHLLDSDTHRLKHKKIPFIFHSTADTKRAGVAILIKDSIAF